MDEKDKFIEKYNLPKQTQEAESLNIPLSIKQME